jgi:alkylation response protein AidB-like acyl-CoA dehydrogenase
MGVAYTDEQQQIRETLRAFFTRTAPPAVMAEIDRSERYPEEILRGMADLGLWGIAIDEDHGGNDADEVTRCIIVEEIQRAGASLGYAFVSTALFCAPAIANHGTKEQKDKLLPQIAAGDLRMAMMLTEPDAGSDLMRLSTRATPNGDGFILSGQKTFATGADVASLLLVLVRTDPEASASKALSFVLVPPDAPGVTIQSLRKLAGQGTHTCEVFFDDVELDPESVLGGVGSGTRMVFDLLEPDRVYVGAQSLGIAQGALDLAVQYASERVQFGKAILEHQAVGHMLADMAIDVAGARHLVYDAAQRLQEGKPCTWEASIAKIAASEAATRTATRGMQVLGGYSYMVEYGMERYYREAKIQEIFGGTNQILRNVLVRELARGSARMV